MLRHGVARGPDRRWPVGEHLGHDRLHRAPGERRVAGEHLVRHRAERVDVGARVDRALPHRLLGGHVLRCAEREAGLRHALAAGRLHREGDAEVGNQRVAALQQDILGLDIAVDHAAPVCVRQRVGDLAGDAQRFGYGEQPVAHEPRAQRLAVHERHDVEQEAAGLARVVQWQDVRVLQVGRGADFREESLGAEGSGEVGMQHLDRDLARVLEVVREVDGGHPALPEFALEPVATAKCRRERRGHVAHRVSTVASNASRSLID